MTNLTTTSDESAHQTVTEFIKRQTPDETLPIGFTDQKVSGRAGLLTFASFLHWHRFGELLAEVMPRFKRRRRGYQPVEYALGFLAGILAGAQKLTHVAPLRRDVMLAPLLAIQGIPSQSAFSRFFQHFTAAGKNLATFRPLGRWGLERLCSRPDGYALDWDSMWARPASLNLRLPPDATALARCCGFDLRVRAAVADGEGWNRDCRRAISSVCDGYTGTGKMLSQEHLRNTLLPIRNGIGVGDFRCAPARMRAIIHRSTCDENHSNPISRFLQRAPAHDGIAAKRGAFDRTGKPGGRQPSQDV